jgi:hypothetical protein
MDELTDHGIDTKTADSQIESFVKKFYSGEAFTDAESSIMDNVAMTDSKAEKILTNYAGMSAEEAAETVEKWTWMYNVEGAENISTEAISLYNENLASTGISKSNFVLAWKTFTNTSGDYDSNGKSIAYSKAKKVFAYINTLPITSEQKTALALCWWKQDTVNKYKVW